ncbi:MAG: membrane protein insertion efficiency factor YidD [Kiritimatiellae bacterium]|jgi:putative component of membrane protein insertase Oxa1/YidC/SpoIIIJ protein YidD|nr:membrane protein insertion efficiency factor YidD [Kiritimatiellia bacterium]
MKIFRIFVKRNLILVGFLFYFLHTFAIVAQTVQSKDVTTKLIKQFAKDANWKNCYVEAMRADISYPENQEFKYYKAMSALKLNKNNEESLETLYKIYTSTNLPTSNRTKTLAAYEYGREQWKQANDKQAFDGVTYTFYNTKSPELFILSGCALFQFASDFPQYKKDNPDLYMQINSSRDLWNAKYFTLSKVEIKHENTGLITKAGKGFITFYRTQIGPAIGDRCVLQPSCSEYFKQNLNAHGIVALPMQTDRFFREPDMAHRSSNVIIVNGKVKHTDPISDHDFWFEKK